jgi:hypothetical protein
MVQLSGGEVVIDLQALQPQGVGVKDQLCGRALPSRLASLPPNPAP